MTIPESEIRNLVLKMTVVVIAVIAWLTITLLTLGFTYVATKGRDRWR